ncbi:hypothetical protein BD779DRAFT_1483088, partial [Infundibulicybe gibba]
VSRPPHPATRGIIRSRPPCLYCLLLALAWMQRSHVYIQHYRVFHLAPAAIPRPLPAHPTASIATPASLQGPQDDHVREQAGNGVANAHTPPTPNAYSGCRLHPLGDNIAELNYVVGPRPARPGSPISGLPFSRSDRRVNSRHPQASPFTPAPDERGAKI